MPGSIHQDADGWWFWDETWSDRHGPFLTEQVAHEKFDAYCAELNGELYLTREEFKDAVVYGWFTPDDGSAIIQGGQSDGVEWDWDSKFPKDATGVRWYSK